MQAAAVGGLATAAGRLLRNANEALSPVAHAVTWTGIADSRLLRNPDLPASRLLSDLAQDGRMKGMGNAFTALGLVAGTVQTWTDVVRLEQNVDWDLTNPVYTQGLNPFSAHDRDEVLIPSMKETATGFIELVIDDRIP